MAASIPLSRDAATSPLAAALIVISFIVLTSTRVETWWVMLGAAAVGLGAKLFG
jgi:chromate transporter